MRAPILTACCYLAGTIFFMGCDSGKDSFKQVDSGKNKTADTFGHGDHDHEHGPHNGAVIELGNHEFHGELVMDEKTKVIGVYLYGPDLKTPVPIDAKTVKLNLKVDGKMEPLEVPAKPLPGESGGKSSHFEVAAPEEVAKDFHDAEDLEGSLQFVIGDKPYDGAFKPHDHGDHKDAGHKHDDHDHADHKDADDKGKDKK